MLLSRYRKFISRQYLVDTRHLNLIDLGKEIKDLRIKEEKDIMLWHLEACGRMAFKSAIRRRCVQFVRRAAVDQNGPAKQHYRQYTNSNFKKDKLKYGNEDAAMRKQIVDSAIGTQSNTISAASLNRRLPFKTIILIVACASSFTMAAYAGVQYYQCQKHRVKKSFLLPLWLHSHFMGKKIYSFPGDLRYLDPECYRFFITQLSEETAGSGTRGIELLPSVLEEENIKYKILEEMSRNNNIRQMFKVPFDFALLTEHFRIWIDPKYPTISGIKIDIDPGHEKTVFGASWSIRLVDIRSIFNDFALIAGVKLDKLEASQIQKSSDNDEACRVTLSKGYDIRFSGQMRILNTTKSYLGTIKYKGSIDFNHILLNRGVKINEIEMIVNSDNSGIVRYKIV